MCHMRHSQFQPGSDDTAVSPSKMSDLGAAGVTWHELLNHVQVSLMHEATLY